MGDVLPFDERTRARGTPRRSPAPVQLEVAQAVARLLQHIPEDDLGVAYVCLVRAGLRGIVELVGPTETAGIARSLVAQLGSVATHR